MKVATTINYGEYDPTKLSDMTEFWFLDAPETWHNNAGPKGFWAVGNDDEGIISYFANEQYANQFRNQMIFLTVSEHLK